VVEVKIAKVLTFGMSVAEVVEAEAEVAAE